MASEFRIRNELVAADDLDGAHTDAADGQRDRSDTRKNARAQRRSGYRPTQQLDRRNSRAEKAAVNVGPTI
jgi:hypothetical protein